MNHCCKKNWKYVWDYEEETTITGQKKFSILNTYFFHLEKVHLRFNDVNEAKMNKKYS